MVAEWVCTFALVVMALGCAPAVEIANSSGGTGGAPPTGGCASPARVAQAPAYFSAPSPSHLGSLAPPWLARLFLPGQALCAKGTGP